MPAAPETTFALMLVDAVPVKVFTGTVVCARDIFAGSLTVKVTVPVIGAEDGPVTFVTAALRAMVPPVPTLIALGVALGATAVEVRQFMV